MNILITAGNTHAPIDRLRVITNVFTGRTGAHLARTAFAISPMVQSGLANFRLILQRG